MTAQSIKTFNTLKDIYMTAQSIKTFNTPKRHIHDRSIY